MPRGRQLTTSLSGYTTFLPHILQSDKRCCYGRNRAKMDVTFSCKVSAAVTELQPKLEQKVSTNCTLTFQY